jgi:two-component system chemotaxis sensor kinase CheA
MIEQIAVAPDAASCSLPAEFRSLLEQLGCAPAQDPDMAEPTAETTSAPTTDGSEDTRSSTVRVSTRRLDALINLVGELMVSHCLAVENPLVREARQRRRRRALLRDRSDEHGLALDRREDLTKLAKDLTGSSKLISQLHDLAVALRMIPLRGVFEKAARLTRDISRKCGKELELQCQGEETELDRSMVEMLYDPLVHMIRNAAVHGIESADQRRRAGKTARAVLQLAAWSEAGEVVVSLRDDGRGLDVEAIKHKGVQRGLVAPDVDLSPAQIQELIFHPGFSTAAEVDGLAGRGVGMDVVRRNIEAMRGRVEVYSQADQGTEFRLRLPLTTAVEDVLALRVSDQTFLLATRAILRTIPARDAQIRPVGDHGQVVIDQGQPIRLTELGSLVGMPLPSATARQAQVVIVSQGHRRTAILVDALLARQQVVIKPLGRILSRLAMFASGAILGDGQVALVLDPRGLLDKACRQEALSTRGVA